MKIKPRSKLESDAEELWEMLQADYQPCEVVYVISELTRRASLDMLQREKEREEEI
ncbi:MAG: hypothetical protein AB9879_09915 [Methanothrix sp.]